jgi:hypothetical protein
MGWLSLRSMYSAGTEYPNYVINQFPLFMCNWFMGRSSRYERVPCASTRFPTDKASPDLRNWPVQRFLVSLKIIEIQSTLYGVNGIEIKKVCGVCGDGCVNERKRERKGEDQDLIFFWLATYAFLFWSSHM